MKCDSQQRPTQPRSAGYPAGTMSWKCTPAQASSVKASLSRPAHQWVTQAVGQTTENCGILLREATP